MPRSLTLVLALATLTVGANAYATDPAGPGTSSDNIQTQQAAPIERAYPDQNANQNGAANTNPAPKITTSHPIAGVALRVEGDTAVQTVSADAKGTELRITHGVANVSVHHPQSKNARILVDLPGGQTALLKDGLYTFNADTNTIRVLKGEADAYPGAVENGVKVKEDHQFIFAAAASRVTESSRDELMADYLPGNAANGDGPAARPGYGYGPYGDGFYGYPYYAYGPYGYPYGYYPYGFGLGFGYGGFGGFRGGGFRGGRFR